MALAGRIVLIAAALLLRGLQGSPSIFVLDEKYGMHGLLLEVMLLTWLCYIVELLDPQQRPSSCCAIIVALWAGRQGGTMLLFLRGSTKLYSLVDPLTHGVENFKG